MLSWLLIFLSDSFAGTGNDGRYLIIKCFFQHSWLKNQDWMTVEGKSTNLMGTRITMLTTCHHASLTQLGDYLQQGRFFCLQGVAEEVLSQKEKVVLED